jgi:signal transduction histidine kinase
MAEHDDEIASIFAAGGEMGALMRRVDWSSTSLGRPEIWPQSLRTSLSICLCSRYPTCLCWGANHVLLYNDAWIPMAGSRHPWALARMAAEVWLDAWDAIKPVFDAATARSEGAWVDDIGFLGQQRGDGEEWCFGCAVSAIRGEGGAVVGLFNAAIKTTARPAAIADLGPRPERAQEPASGTLTPPAGSSDAAEALQQALRLAAEVERTALLERLVNLQEQERLRIARDLHDRMGQDLTGLSLGLKSLETVIADENGRNTLRWLLALTAQIGSNVHRTAWELRPTSLDDVGLARALETYVADWSERLGIHLDFHAACGGIDHFPPSVEITAYRVVQEALTNVLKHAGATTVSIVLECYDGWLRIIIEDDGKGFDADLAAKQGKLGLPGMRERVGLLGGTMAIDSAIGTGTTLYIRIPLEPVGGGARDVR